jgi:hypothetical protein
MLPLQQFRNRGFALTNAASLLMFFGMFGSIFLLAQFLQAIGLGWLAAVTSPTVPYATMVRRS